jgi:hypothetical protein
MRRGVRRSKGTKQRSTQASRLQLRLDVTGPLAIAIRGSAEVLFIRPPFTELPGACLGFENELRPFVVQGDIQRLLPLTNVRDLRRPPPDGRNGMIEFFYLGRREQIFSSNDWMRSPLSHSMTRGRFIPSIVSRLP